MKGLSPLITTTSLTAFHLPRSALIQLLLLPYLDPRVQRNPWVISEVILSGRFSDCLLTFFTFVPSCEFWIKILLIKTEGTCAGIPYIYLFDEEPAWVSRPGVYLGTDASGCSRGREDVYDWYVNAAVWSLVYRKIQTVSEECRIPFGMRALCSQEKSHPLNSSISALPRFSPLLLWLYHQRERTHMSGENWGRRLCFVNNALIIICTCT